MLTLLQPFNLDSSKDYTFANATLGNVATANYYTGNGSLLSGVIAITSTTAGTVTTAAQPNITSVGTLSSLSVTGNVSANYFIGDGSLLTNINAANITGAYGNSNVSDYLPTYLPSYNGNLSVGNIDVITTLDAGTIRINATSGNIYDVNYVSANYIIGNGSLLSSLTGSNVSGNVSSAVQSHYANIANSISGSNVSGNVDYAITSNWANTANSVSGTNVTGQVGNALIAGTVYTNAQPNITSVGTLLGLSVTGNLDITGNINATGNLNYSNVNDLVVGDPLIYLGANNTGNLYDLGFVASYNDGTYYHTGLARDATDGTWKLFDGVVAEPTTVIDFANGTYAPFKSGEFTSIANITSINANLGNLTISNYFRGDGSLLSNLTGSNVSGNVTYAITSNWANTANSISGSNVSGNVDYAITSNWANTANSVAGANVTGYVPNATAANTAGTVTTAAQPNITSLGTLTGLTSTGIINVINSSNVSLGNVSNLHITGGNSGYVLQTDGSGTLTWADPTPNTVTYLANSITLTNGVYVTGNLYSIQVFGDYAEPDGVYTLTDGTGAAPAWIFDVDYTSVTTFNRVVMNINYTASSGHTIYVQLYNYDTSFTLASGTVTTTTGTNIVTVSSTANMVVGQTIKFGTSVGGLTAGATYYIISIPSSGQLTVGTGTGSGTTVSLSTDSQTSTVEIQNWDNIGTYTGLGSYYAFALQVIDDTAYISSGVVKLRLFHSNQGSASHTTNIDYLALELSNQGPQGPRGPTGATGATGATGNGVASGGTTGQVLIKNSGSNYDTSWTSDLTSLGNITITSTANLGNLVISNYFSGNGSYLTSLTGANVSGYVPNANIANTATTAGTVTTAAQPNITSTGTLTSLTVSGLLTATGTGIKVANVQDSTGTVTLTTKYNNITGDVGVYGNLTAGASGTGNVIATYFIGDGSQLTGISGSGATITDNTSANTTYYPVYATSNTGAFTTAGISTTKLQFNPSSGQLTVQDLNTLSDATLKTNAEVIDDPFTILNQIFGMGFNWADSGKKSYGLMAQMLEKILPELVSENAQGKKTVNYIPIIAFLIEAVKKNQAEIEELKKDKYL